ncbi:MAG: ABC transporter ATP-binding protein/permease, partial [Bacilli bacterium]|nr:ABC transporter ATP-binding protein/permease [Bacilli bacterium]
SIFCDFTTVLLRRNTQIFFRGTTKDIQMDLAKKVLNTELESVDSHGSGTFIQRLVKDTDDMSRIFTKGMGYLTGILTDIGIFVAVFLINKIVFLYLLICSIILTIFQLMKAKAVNKEDKIYRRQSEKTNGLIGELIRGIRDIKMLYAKHSFVDNIEDNIDKLTESNFRMRNVEMDYNCVIDIIYDICELILIILMIYLLSIGKLNVASAIVIYNYRSRIFNNLMQNVDNLLEEVRGFNLSCNRVFSILYGNEFKKEEFGKEHVKKINGELEFKDVNFSYGEKKVLKGMSFKIAKNETVAFVGKSGVGKTTIFSLLCKLYNHQSGSIYLDGHNINDLDEESIRNNITIISQNPYIFNMSIRDNFRLIKKDVTDKEIKKACKLACLTEFIESLPDKYDTVIGEGGVNLSGGQRQRLAIARAFIQDTKIILFDEATSALDNETQKYIQEAINNMKEKYTILIIAHRLSTIVESDRIMVVDDGKIIATGPHKELLRKNKYYKKLYEKEVIEE